MTTSNNNSLEKLIQISRGDPEPPSGSYMSAASQKAVDDAARFLVDTEGIAPSQRWAKFRRHMENWEITHDNRDEMFDLLHSTHPNGADGSLKLMWSELQDTFSSMDTPLEVEGFIRDNYYKLPPEFSNDLEKLFNTTVKQGAAQSLEYKGRAGLCYEFRNSLNNLNLDGLDPSSSARAVERTLSKAFHYGLLDNAVVNKRTGILEVPQPEGNRPVSTLPDIEDQQLRFFADNDQASIARPFVRNALDKARSKAKETTRKTVEAMYENMEVLPDDIITNVAIDYAMYQENPVSSLTQTIKKLTEQAVERGEAGSFKDVAGIYLSIHSKIQESLLRRIEGYD
jgi:hypothetical protein